MQPVSNKSKLQQICLFFAINNATELEKNVVISDEDLLFLMTALNMQRYSVEKSWKPVPNELIWWNKALNDVNFNEDVFRSHFRMNREPFWKLCQVMTGK